MIQLRKVPIRMKVACVSVREIWGHKESNETNCELIQYWELMLMFCFPFVKTGEGIGGFEESGRRTDGGGRGKQRVKAEALGWGRRTERALPVRLWWKAELCRRVCLGG